MFRQSLSPARIPNHQPSSYGPSAAILRVLDHPYFVVWCFGLFILLRTLTLLVSLEMTSDADWYRARGWNRSGRRLFAERTPDRILACRLSWISRQRILVIRYLEDNWDNRQSGMRRRKPLPRSGADATHLSMQSICPAGSGVARDLS